MKVEMGELVVGAYLKLRLECAFVDYNVRPPGGGVEGLGELDVVGLAPDRKQAYLCEVTTHIRRLLYVNNEETVNRIRRKHDRQKLYATKYLKAFPKVTYMFWSPVVPTGYITTELEKIKGLELKINQDYAACVRELQSLAAEEFYDSGNDFFRALQILANLRE